MASAIDPSQPTAGTATTASVRANFAAAKTEIESLQAALASVPLGVGELTMTAGQALTAGDVAVLSPADHKVYRAVGGAATTNTTMPTAALQGAAMAYDPVSDVIVHTYMISASGSLVFVTGRPNSDGTITWGTPSTYAGFGLNSEYLGDGSVCFCGHTASGVSKFFLAVRSTSSSISFFAFLADGETVSFPTATKTTYTTASVSPTTDWGTRVIHHPGMGKVYVITPGTTAHSLVLALPAPDDNCALDIASISLAPTTQSVALNRVNTAPHVAVYRFGDYAVWLYGESDNNSLNCGTGVARVINLATLEVSPAVYVTQQHSMIPLWSVAHENKIFLLCTEHSYNTSPSLRGRNLYIKTVEVDGGGIVLPDGLAARTLIYAAPSNHGAANVTQNRVGGAGYLAYAPADGTLTAITDPNGVGEVQAKYFRPATGELIPEGTTSMTSVTSLSGSKANRWTSGCLSHPALEFAYFGAARAADGQFVAVRPPHAPNLNAASYLGVVKETAAPNATVRISTPPAVIGGLAGLTPATPYFAQPDNTFSSVKGEFGVQAGIAISPTQLLLRG